MLKYVMRQHCIYYRIVSLSLIETLNKFNTKRVYMFWKLCFVFLCIVQGVQCVLYNQQVRKI